MGGLLWLLWFFLGSSAIHHTVAGSQQEDVVLLRSWGSLALSSAMVLIVVVVVKWLGKKSHSEDVREIKQEDVLKSQEELKSSLWQALSQMEQELVKLVTLVRSRKARLAAGHHSCKASECQEDRGSTHKPFNLAVYDIVEGD